MPSDPELNRWIMRVNGERTSNPEGMLARGNWHGYKEDPEYHRAGPMKGRFILVRWKQPTVAVSSDNQDELFPIATEIEAALVALESWNS